MLGHNHGSIVTGLAAIDRQHLKYFKLVDRIMQDLAQNLPAGKWFRALNAHVITHLQSEERLMLQAGYPRAAIQAHRQQHLWFRQQLNILMHRASTLKNIRHSDLFDKTSELLIVWTAGHIRQQDHTVGRKLSAASRSQRENCLSH